MSVPVTEKGISWRRWGCLKWCAEALVENRLVVVCYVQRERKMLEREMEVLSGVGEEKWMKVCGKSREIEGRGGVNRSSREAPCGMW